MCLENFKSEQRLKQALFQICKSVYRNSKLHSTYSKILFIDFVNSKKCKF